MKKFTFLTSCTLFGLFCFCLFGKAYAQPLKITDFAIWGGGGSPTPYNGAQGVFIYNNAVISGNIGSNHVVSIANNLTFKGNIYSGNTIAFGNAASITGNFFAERLGAPAIAAITGGNNALINGNLSGNGKVTVANGSETGSVSVPATTDYTGPRPSAGVNTNVILPVLPIMPGNTPFDDQIGTVSVTSTKSLSPGRYRKMALTGNKTITFSGPGNYIFYEVDNGATSNKFEYDFKNSASGTINIFVIKDARWGTLTVSTKNGNFPSRVFTEIHGNGSSFSGNSFDLVSPKTIPSGSALWLGNVWAPNGGIAISNTLPSATPHVIGALWSGKQVSVKNDLRLVYAAPAAEPSYVTPYYPPPPSGKVNAANNVIGAELFSLLQNSSNLPLLADNEIFILDGKGNVMIEVVSKNLNDAALKAQLMGLGLTDTINNGPHEFMITGYFPIAKLAALNTITNIQYVRPLYPALTNGGQVTSQGDTTMRSFAVRERFGVDGTGVKIGVISDSYDLNVRAQEDVNQGDLPGERTNGTENTNANRVQVLADLPDRGHDEGRAMLQIVHDVAPMAKLAFRTGFLTAGDFAQGILDLSSPDLAGGRCDVIVDDITYITEPFLRDGVVAKVVDSVVGQGVTYFSSAGNFGSKSYEGTFVGVTNISLVPVGQVHRFGSNASEVYQTLKLKPGSYTIVLQWDDEFHSLGSAGGVQSDLDLYLVGSNGYTLFGFNRSNLFGDPYEVCPFTVSEETSVRLIVARAAGAGTVRFKYIVFRGEATIQDYVSGTSSIVGHPNAKGAIAVGAMLYANIPSVTTVWPGVASFSSRGGTLTRDAGTSVQRNKPEIIGPNGVNTTVNFGGALFNDGDAYPNFFGTSAAAPHVAAVGALLIQAKKKFGLQTNVLPSEIKQHLISSAGRFSYLPGGFTFEGGNGYAQADSAVAQIANARPIIKSLQAVMPGAQNGTVPFDVKITGAYLTPNTVIYYNGNPVTTTVSADKTEAIANISPIPVGQDPPFQLYNPPKSPSELDGGLSEPLHFFSSVVGITIRAQNKSKKYGQANPQFTAEILYNGVLMTNPDTLAILKLNPTDISFQTIGSAASSPGLYGIFPSRTVSLEASDPLLANYKFTFVSGTLSVGKMPLKITPQNKIVTYGNDLGPITFNYELDLGRQTSTELLNEVKTLHEKYLASNGLIVLNGFGSTRTVSTADLVNMSTLASFQAIRNARKFVFEGEQLVPLTREINPLEMGSTRFFVDVSVQSLQNYKQDSAMSALAAPGDGLYNRAFLNVKALLNGTAKVSLINGQLKPMVNGQLLAMVNGQLVPMVNGQLVAMVNGQLQALVNGQLLAMVNGQLMALVNGQLELVEGLTLTNGQLQALVNGQLQALVNGQLKAMVNGVVTDISTTAVSLVNGQLQALVNGQLQALVNGQLQAIVNGELPPLVNGDGIPVSTVRQLANGQLQALVNGEQIPIANGQLLAMVNDLSQPLLNGQLLAMVNGQLMSLDEDGNVSFAVFANGQLQALVNGQLRPLVNGQLKAIVNGELQTVNSYSITNGQLQAIINGENWVYANGQLLALVNGQLQALVNNFAVDGAANNANTVVLVDEDDVVLQAGDIGAMFSLNMITGLDAGKQTLVPGAFVNENFEVTYGLGEIDILKAPLIVKATDKTKVYGEANPTFSFDYNGMKYGESSPSIIDPPLTATSATSNSPVGSYPIYTGGGASTNYSFTTFPGALKITKKALSVKADNQTKTTGSENPPLTITYDGLVGDDTKDSVCVPFIIPPSPQVISQLARITTYSDVKLNGRLNYINAQPGESITLTGHRNTVYYDPTDYCTGCITQLYIGMSDTSGKTNLFTTCFDVSLYTLTEPGRAQSSELNIQFAAPTLPGVYYITQVSSWQYFCYQDGSGIASKNPEDAIAVVVVNVANNQITASTVADVNSGIGTYPIVLQACSSVSANYEVSLTDGVLTVLEKGIIAAASANSSREDVTNGARFKDKLYPNPASGRIRLELGEDVRQSTDIQLYDQVGKLTTASQRRVSERVYEIDVSNLQKGVYFLKVKVAGQIKTFKFVKL